MPARFAALRPLLILLAGGALLTPAAASADGGASIVAAPVFGFGVPVSGGGLPSKQYYRLRLFAGDLLTFDLSEGPTGFGSCTSNVALQVFEPDVTDFQIGNATPLTTIGSSQGMHEATWTSPFTGEGIFRELSCGGGPIASFTLTITDAHETSVSVKAPPLAQRGSRVTITARVQSEAGAPAGSCLIAGKPAVVSPAGTCTGRVGLGRGSRSTVQVSFVGDDDWQSSVGQRTIRLYG